MQLVVAIYTNCKDYFRSASGDCYTSSNCVVLTQVFLKTVQVSDSHVLFSVR